MDVVMYLIFGVCCGIMASIFTVCMRLEDRLNEIINLLEETESEGLDEDSN